MVGTKPQTTACFLSKAAWLVSIKLGPSALCVGDKFLVGTSLSLLLPIWMCMVECLYNDIIIILRFVHTVVQQQSINTRVTLRSLLSFFLFFTEKNDHNCCVESSYWLVRFHFPAAAFDQSFDNSYFESEKTAVGNG